MPTALSVNLNKLATLRNTRPLAIPSLARAGAVALDAGAAGLTVHPRPDERHIRAADVAPLAGLCAERSAEFNIEGNPFEGRFLQHCRDVRPTQATLVPDTPGQSTSDHGWNLAADGDRLRPVVAELRDLGCRVSLFVDPSADMALARDVGADRVELYTEPYARAFDRGAPTNESVGPFAAAARAAAGAGLGVNAGHDLNLGNLPPFLREVPGVLEVSIGHALIADAVFDGLAATVAAYVAATLRA